LEGAISSDQEALQRELGVVVADFRRRQAIFSDELAQATTKSDAAVAKVTRDIDVCTRKVAAVQWRKGKIDREHRRYAHLTFGHFLRRTMVGR
jgi:hypothetical protein